ncbi:hypothetical protein I551_8984 [Mycobacterium ulcerans str. Harvey]|uniref:Uncharacterized protein n=1 Tax=Mycobacterium ulcerans str. Harvey TaxID=1299332 RepID=A0ABN0R9A0_MYCUL|nr:hypothetical protein I551_8984 [Mycobacterium ulcerans str. Harvey]
MYSTVDGEPHDTAYDTTTMTADYWYRTSVTLSGSMTLSLPCSGG